MRSRPADLRRPDPSLHQTGTEGLDGTRGTNELRLLEHFGMRPSSDILDIGCGIGRLAYECASYLDDDATYTGLDIAPVVIEWLDAHYAPVLPGFRFDLLDVHSERYRADGTVEPEQVRLPYADGSYDVVCAFEVFMHLSLDGVRNYLREIARVLRPGGLAVVTFVAILPGGGHELDHDGRTYVEVAPGVYTLFPNRTNLSMAYDLDLIRSAVEDAGLDEVELIKGLLHERAHARRLRRDHVRRERRRRMIGERMAETGVVVTDAMVDGVGPPPESPPIGPEEIEVAPLSHNCDLLAARKRR